MKNENTYDILVVGELNIDLIFNSLNNYPEIGKEQKAENMAFVLGSSSAIFASNCSSLGSKVTFCGKIGDDEFGDFILKALRQKKVHTGSVLIDENLKTGATVIFNYENDRMMVTHPGAMEHLKVDEIPVKAFKKSRHLHTSSIFLQPEIKNSLKKLLSKAKEFGLTTSMDVQWDPEENWDINLEELFPLLDFFMPNEDEFLQLTNSSNLTSALKKVSFFETCVVIKRGRKGAILQKNKEITSVPAYQVANFTDAIGAGDSFNAGFISCYLKGESLHKCLKFGNLTAAVSTTEAGGTSAIKSYKGILEKGRSMKLSAL